MVGLRQLLPWRVDKAMDRETSFFFTPSNHQPVPLMGIDENFLSPELLHLMGISKAITPLCFPLLLNKKIIAHFSYPFFFLSLPL